MTADTCKYPGCGADTGHRPYARKRDAPSASAIAEMLDDGKGRSFAWAASLIAATEAVHNPGAWSGLIDVPSDRALKNGATSCDHTKDGLCKACTYLRSEFDRRWTAKATVGTHIHHLALSWSKGETVDVDEACDGYMDALQDFWEHRQPEWLHLESTVQGVRGGKVAWRGQFDWLARVECPVCPATPDTDGYSPRCVWLGDYKTGGYYPASQTLQLSLYRYATNITTWADGVETVSRPMPPVVHAGVCLLSPDGYHRLVELPVDGEAFNTALRLLDIHRWQQKMRAWAKAHPLEADTTTDNEGEAA